MAVELGPANLIPRYTIEGSYLVFSKTSEKLFDAPLRLMDLSERSLKAIAAALYRHTGYPVDSPKLSDLLKLTYQEIWTPTNLGAKYLNEIKDAVLSFYKNRKEQIPPIIQQDKSGLQTTADIGSYPMPQEQTDPVDATPESTPTMSQAPAPRFVLGYEVVDGVIYPCGSTIPIDDASIRELHLTSREFHLARKAVYNNTPASDRDYNYHVKISDIVMLPDDSTVFGDAHPRVISEIEQKTLSYLDSKKKRILSEPSLETTSQTVGEMKPTEPTMNDDAVLSTCQSKNDLSEKPASPNISIRNPRQSLAAPVLHEIPASYIKPELYVKPGIPTEPEKSVELEPPAEPELASESDAPVEPKPPAEFEAHTEPEQPIEPELPTKPRVPVELEPSVEPEVPYEPEWYAEPKRAVGQEVPVEPRSTIKIVNRTPTAVANNAFSSSEDNSGPEYNHMPLYWGRLDTVTGGHEPELFCDYVMSLFVQAGHIESDQKPEFSNHSAEELIYFDIENQSISLSDSQRSILTSFNNVSRLFTLEGCVFYSINLVSLPTQRSRLAYDVHNLIHPLTDVSGTIIVFLHDGCVMLSFMGFRHRCILSDWYSIDDDELRLLDKLDIANMTIYSDADYFADFVYLLARPYYFASNDAPVFSLIPIDAFSCIEGDELDREEINLIINDQLNASQREYGYDYVEYDEQTDEKQADISTDIDLMLLEMDDMDENPFGEELEPDEEDVDEFADEYGDGFLEEDDFDLEGVDPEIFKDPTLMVKWLEKNP